MVSKINKLLSYNVVLIHVRLTSGLHYTDQWCPNNIILITFDLLLCDAGRIFRTARRLNFFENSD
ncbi:hypothetical protein PEC302110_33610 [Pectobacterium araliae]|uniref:Uncharacterized protein n=1 Tax=Pectobacterium araliae TaxID=3073862 RepID=A0AAN0KCM1_9GAMM|nr:hypothetical protein PEC302110_33610 [Pectobacterium sp. MAFF 302110]